MKAIETLSRDVAKLTVLACLTGIPLAACADSATDPGKPVVPRSPAANAVETTVVLTAEDFDSTPLGDEPYPFIAETWCPEAFVGVTDEVSNSGSRSIKYFDGCGDVNGTITTVSFALCTRWPTAAQVTFFRRHDDYVNSDFALFSGSGQEEPRTAILFGSDGGIRLSAGLAPDLLVGQYQLGIWTKVHTAWDFVSGSVDLWLDDVYIGAFDTHVTKAFWLLFGSGDQGSTFYDDDVTVSLDLRGERQNCDGTEPLPWPWPPEEGQQGG